MSQTFQPEEISLTKTWFYNLIPLRKRKKKYQAIDSRHDDGLLPKFW